MTARPIGSDLLGRPAAASHGIGFGRLAPWLGAGAAFLCGLAIPFNVILLSQAGQDVRLLDVVSMAMFPVALWLSLRRTYLLLALLLLGVVFFLPSLIQAAVLFARYDELNDIVFPVRFLTAIVLCGALTPLLDRARPRSLFALGMGLGCCLNIIPLVFERLGQHQTMVALGLAPSDLAVQPWDLQLRPPGLHGHANATSAVISLARATSGTISASSKQPSPATKGASQRSIRSSTPVERSSSTLRSASSRGTASMRIAGLRISSSAIVCSPRLSARASTPIRRASARPSESTTTR